MVQLNRRAGKTDEIRRLILEVAANSSGPVHLGGSLSEVEILDTLYGRILNVDPADLTKSDRDIFILSKGHAFLGLLATLCVHNLLPKSRLLTFQKGGEGSFISHPVRDVENGIESSTGSLGQGLSYGLGIAAGMKLRSENNRQVIVLMGDSECAEGSVWEAAILAPKLALDNVTVIVDCNGLGNDRAGVVQSASQLAAMFEAAGWDCRQVDGHNSEQIFEAISSERTASASPRAVIASTVKGKGVPFMEGDNDWHHAQVSSRILERALEGLV